MYIFIIHIHYTVLCIESFALTGPGKVLSQYLIAVLYTTVMNQLKRTVSRKKFGFYLSNVIYVINLIDLSLIGYHNKEHTRNLM